MHHPAAAARAWAGRWSRGGAVDGRGIPSRLPGAV